MDTNHTDDDAFLDKIAALRDADRQAGRDEIWDEIQDATEIAGSEAYHRLRHRFQTEPCPTCEGEGKFYDENINNPDPPEICPTCDGTGTIPTWKAVALRIAEAASAAADRDMVRASRAPLPTIHEERARALVAFSDDIASRDWSGKGDDE